MRRRSLVPLLLVALAGCGPKLSVYYAKPVEWRTPGGEAAVIERYRPQLDTLTIYLDPGHGGTDHNGKGPSGETEAAINLRVALHLRDYLQAAGATVIISRTTDATVGLRDRSTLANASGADFFVSIHHNAVDDALTNYTSTWYHARPSDSAYHPANQDIARYVQRDLAYAMGNNGSNSTFDGTMSDYIVYPNAGFSVLRYTTLPAILVEGSFWSNVYEEARLKKDEFNQIEAFGIFKGLGRYFAAGVPRIAPATRDSVFTGWRPNFTLNASDSRAALDSASLEVRIDGRKLTDVRFDRRGRITATPSRDLANGPHRLDVRIRNANGNGSWPFGRLFTVAPTVAGLTAVDEPSELPGDPRAVARIRVRAVDAKGDPVADGTMVLAQLPQRTDTLRTIGGEALGYTTMRPGDLKATFTVRGTGASRAQTTGVLIRNPDLRGPFVDLTVTDSAGRPIPNAAVRHRSVADALGQTDANGRFLGSMARAETLIVAAPGFYGARLPVAGAVTQSSATLRPVAAGRLGGRRVLIDAWPADSLDEAQMAYPEKWLVETLRAYGVDARRSRDLVTGPLSDSAIFRAAAAAFPGGGIHLRLLPTPPGPNPFANAARVIVFPNEANTAFGEALRTALGGGWPVVTQRAGYFSKTPLGGIAVQTDPGSAIFRLPGAVIRALLAVSPISPGRSISVQLADATGKPLPNTVVHLTGTIPAMTNSLGIALFDAVTLSDDEIFFTAPTGATVQRRP